ncbi:hypothetical protein F4813DRAFT_396229 [Daldinia decipiens]|uniref:uncharacterized protein n=1 Tax=Daldinia decipiens TaxID=326647 RepID=UPI0020C39285|nr:uncharacterized protein F4813DRAFT_396229 [Daldinia decipiens]KAI1657712.1 hypothetical protein F4813DRAFT_396229 [Daldinia decipiens]
MGGLWLIFLCVFMGLSCFLVRFLRARISTRQVQASGIVERKAAESIFQNDKLLYYRLQNLEDHPGALAQAQGRLIQLLDITVDSALKSTTPNFLSVPEFCLQSLRAYLADVEAATADAWASYLKRRSSGGGRELFHTSESAKQWLRLSAPVRCVDGAWLSRIHHARTPERLRPSTRIAWQILSEELGDGILERNHVYIYSKLLQSVGLALGPGNSAQFIELASDPDRDERVWTAAVAQLALGFLTDNFLPEILGFNMAYEAATIETLICAYELKEIGMDPEYFNMHITIDNADSGHTAMAVQAVMSFISALKPSETIQSWKRIQAGYLLAKMLPVTPMPVSKHREEVLSIFSKKCDPAKELHRRCTARIGRSNGKKLGEWLDPVLWETQKDLFLSSLAQSKWIVPGNPRDSNLVRQMGWGGRMFGAFTLREKTKVEEWIRNMTSKHREVDGEAARGRYAEFTGYSPSSPEIIPAKLAIAFQKGDCSLGIAYNPVKPTCIPVQILPSLLIEAATPLQYCIDSPANCATEQGIVAVRIMRILNGLPHPEDAVLGMDEVTCPSEGVVEIAWRVDKTVKQQRRLETSEMNDSSDLLVALQPWLWLDNVARSPKQNYWFLIGAQEGFVAYVLANTAGLRKGGLPDETAFQLGAISEMMQREMSELTCPQPEQRQEGFWAVIRCLEETISRSV